MRLIQPDGPRTFQRREVPDFPACSTGSRVARTEQCHAERGWHVGDRRRSVNADFSLPIAGSMYASVTFFFLFLSIGLRARARAKEMRIVKLARWMRSAVSAVRDAV